MPHHRFAQKIRVLLLILALAPVRFSLALTNNVALTPPMGWNDWNSYGCGISEAAVSNTIVMVATNGMKAAGYQYIDIDDGWASSRDSNGVIQAYSIASKFPDGIKYLADFAHSHGLKLGVYTDHGTNTCSSCISGETPPKQPGSLGYEYLDAFTYASWGADYLKEDNCNVPGTANAQVDYGKMSDGLMKSGRPIVFCLCGGAALNAKSYQSWSPVLGNYWRTTGDISDNYSTVISHIDPNSTSAFAAGPGRWNDPDMLEVGNGNMTATEDQSHFTMWCVMAAPLIMGNNLTTMSSQALATLINPEAIAVDQDPAGEEGVKVVNNSSAVGTNEVWSRTLRYDFTTKAVVLFNRNGPATNITVYWTNLALQPGAATVRDLWAHADLGTFTNSFTTNVASHAAVMLKIVGAPPVLPAVGTNYLSDLPAVYAYTGYGTIIKDKSVNGNTLTLNGVPYPKGIGVNSRAGSDYDLGGICSRFQATIGVDDEETGHGTVIFQVFADGTQIYNSGVMTGGGLSQTINLDVTGVRRLILGVGDSDDGTTDDHADWANALVIVTNTTPQLPYAPTGLTASPGNPVALAWAANQSAASYNLKRATNSGGPYTNLIVSVPLSVYSDTNVTVGSTYYYVVSSVDSIGESTNSTEVSVTACSPPAVPGNVTTSVTTTLSGSQVTVNWSAASGATSYTVYRASSSTPYSPIASGVSGTQYMDPAPPVATTNFYVVAAANSCSQSGFSPFATGDTPPAAPTGLAGSPGSTQAVLTWNAATGAFGYNLKRSTTTGTGYATVGTNVSATSFTDSGLVNNTTYYYVVSSLNGGGEGTNSPQISVKPVAPANAAYWTNTITSSPQSWNVNGNWTNLANFPNSLSGPAVVNPVLAASQTINLNQAITVGTLSIGAANGGGSCTIAPNGGSLTFNNGGVATLTQIAASKGDTITAPVTVATSLSIANASANPFTLAGTISGTAPTLTITGPVQVGDGAVNGSLGTVAFVTNNGALTFARSDSPTVSGSISGTGSITQNGTGTLTLDATNSFSGGVNIVHGTLLTAAAGALGATSGQVVISSGATLDVDGQNPGAVPVTVSGAGNGGVGAIYNSGSQQTQTLQSVTLAGDTSIGGSGPWNPGNNVGRWDIRASTLATLSTTGHPYKLTKVGNNQISIVGITVDAALGDIDITGGLMGFETSTTSMGNSASNLFVRSGATMSFYNATTHWNKVFQLFGNGVTATVTNWSGSNVMIGPVTLNGACVFGIGGTALALTGPVGGSGGLIKNVGGALYLSGVDNYTGATVINGGKLSIVSPGSIAATTNIAVASGATLDVSGLGAGGMTLAAGQTLGGFGSVNGNFTVGSGATLAPGNAIGVLTFDNALTLAAGSTNILAISKSPTTNAQIVVLGSLSEGGTLVVTNISATPLAASDAFALFSAVGYSGAFSAILPARPGPALAWDTSSLTNKGILRVMAVPPPRIGSMTMNAGTMILSGSGGLAGLPYYLLASTNLAQPVSQWTPIATNYFDPSGNFLMTNPVTPSAPRTFYLLQVP